MRNTKQLVAMSLSACLALGLAACTAPVASTTAAAAEAGASAGASEASSEASTEAAETTAAAGGGFDVDRDKAVIESLNPVRPEVLGTVKLGNYNNLEIEGEKPQEVSNDDVEYYVIYTLMPNYKEEVDQADFGDTVNINYTGYKDGVAFDGGTAENYDLIIGSNSFIDGFESGLMGKKKGEEVELNLTFPEDYHSEELAGKDVVFKVKVNSIMRQSTLTDELAHEIDEEVNTVDELKARIKQSMQDVYDQQAEQKALYNAALKAAEQAEIVLSDEAVEWKLDDMIKNYYSPYAEQYYGMDLATVLLFQGMSYENFRKSLRESAETAVKQIITLDAIAEAEGIVADDAAIDAYAEEFDLDRAYMENVMGEEMLKLSVIEDLANKLVLENGTVVYPVETEAETSAAN